MEPLEIHIIGKDGASTVFKTVSDEASNTARKVNKANDDQKRSVENLNLTWKRFAKDLKEVSTFAVQSSAALVGAFTAAFASARKDIPEVNSQLNQLGNTFQALSDNLAKAAMPSLIAFNKFMSGLATAISGFVERNQALVNSFLKYAAITLAVATLGVTIAKFVKAMVALFEIVWAGIGLIVTIATKFTLWGIIISAITALIVIFRKQIVDFLKLIPGVGAAIQGMEETFAKIKGEIDTVLKEFEAGTKDTLKRTEDAYGTFVKGVQSKFNSLTQNIETFGGSVADSLNTAFSDTIFNGITGKLHGLRDIINSFKDDVLKAFSKMAANEILGNLFGDKDGTKKGLFAGGGLGGFINSILGIFGLGSKGSSNSSESPMEKLKKETDKVGDKFNGLAHNMDMFGRAKDRLMDNFNRFSRQIESGQIGLGSRSGFGGGFKFPSPGGAGFPPVPGDNNNPLASIQPLAPEVQSSVTALSDGLTIVSGAALMAQAGIIGIGNAHLDASKSFVIATTIALAASLGALAVSVAAGIASAAALTAAWIPAATAASIATFGAAAAAGGAAVAGAIGSNQAFASSSMNQSFGQMASLTIAPGAGVPFGAEGGIVTSPTLAMIGEAGPEAVIPLHKNGDLGGLDGMQSGGGIHINIDIAEAKLNSPSNIKEFVNMLSSQLGYMIEKRLKRVQGVV